MTLEALQYLVTDLALKRNLVNCAMSGPSIYAINPEDIKEYPLMFISPTGSHTIKENTTRYSLTFFYMDRLLADSSNEESINSAGIETLRNLKLQLSKLEVVTDIEEDVDIRLFTETERMADRVAGAYMTIWIETLNPSTCPAFFDEYGYYMGNYFATEGLEAVLDDLASKEWVNRLIASLSISGITPEEFERIMGKYVLERKFATINGSGITNNQRFSLVEQGDYDEQVQAIYQLISANTQDITQNLTAITQEIQNITNNVTSITENITVLSGDTTEIEQNITNFSAATVQEIENIYQAISAATPEDYEQVKQQVSANTEDMAALSAQTSANTAQLTALTEDLNTLSAFTSGLSFSLTEQGQDIEQIVSAVSGINNTLETINSTVSGISGDLGDLSGYTEQAVSSLTQGLETLSAAISGYTPQGYEALQEQVSANTSDIADLSGYTEAIFSQITSIQSAISGIDDYCFFVSGYTQPWDARNSDDLVDYVKSLGDEFAKARVFINERSNKDWVEYHVYRVSGDTIYITAVINQGGTDIKVKYGYYTKGVSPSQSHFSDFTLSNNINAYITALNGQVSSLNDNKQNKLTAGSGITIQNDVISADVASSDVHVIVGLTQIEYNQLATKDPATLYVIKPSS